MVRASIEPCDEEDAEGVLVERRLAANASGVVRWSRQDTYPHVSFTSAPA